MHPLRLHSGGAEDEYFRNETLMINLYYVDGLDQYEGQSQHITFSTDPGSTWWASDTLLPLRQPFIGDIRILD